MDSIQYVERAQVAWASEIPLDSARPTYAATLADNLFLRELRGATEAEFRLGDGGELEDTLRRPAKMRALISSSALAVNFFDPWRDSRYAGLAKALGVDSECESLRFEYQPRRYPVGPRSPNFDILLTLASGHRVAIESKFTEPFRAPGEDALLSGKYFPEGDELWSRVGLGRVQEVASRLAARWQYLDAAQLVKHMLGLASESEASATLLYLWYDTGLDDALRHREEVAKFAAQVAGERIAFVSCTYQEAFARMPVGAEPEAGWNGYMESRYFKTT